MSMRNFMTVLVTLTLSSFAIAAEPVAQPQSQSKATASNSAKQQTVKHAAVKPQAKPAAPKYYYVRGDSLPTSTAATVSVTGPAVQTQTVTPEPGEVHTGRMVCELGNFVSVTPDPQQPSRFVVQMKKNTYLMTPVETTTGAVRLEDAQAGAMWLQLPHKSMLMNSKLGQRMADECQSEHQTVAAHAMKLNPPPSLLDGPTLAKK
jgi:hypothetical protein